MHDGARLLDLRRNSVIALREAQVVVIGGGIAGASAAYELARSYSVVLLERESQHGYHSTGRSAASFTENYGTSVIRRLAIASRTFLENPPLGFCEYPLLKPRGMITIARSDQLAALDEELRRARLLVPSIEAIDRLEVLKRVPVIRPDYLAAAIIEPMSMEIDVNALHRGFLDGARARGAVLLVNAGVKSLDRRGGKWRLETSIGEFSYDYVVNAAGAWADEIAKLAGLRPVGLQPKRRTAFHIAAPEAADITGWPLINDVDEQFYFKPDAGRIFVSPGDATPSAPIDAYPDDMDVALGVERLQRATTLTVDRAPRAWAGLRTFAPDGSPVIGPDPEEPSFVWLAGQGGYGIKTSPALSSICAELIRHGRLPAAIAAAGITETDISPCRFAGGPAHAASRPEGMVA